MRLHKSRKSLSLPFPAARREKAVWDRPLTMIFNDRSGEMSRVAASGLLRLRSNAASAIAARAKGGSVRRLPVRWLSYCAPAANGGFDGPRCSARDLKWMAALGRTFRVPMIPLTRSRARRVATACPWPQVFERSSLLRHWGRKPMPDERDSMRIRAHSDQGQFHLLP